MKDGTIVYMHVINPVVKGADYTILAILYEANPDPGRAAGHLREVPGRIRGEPGRRRVYHRRRPLEVVIPRPIAVGHEPRAANRRSWLFLYRVAFMRMVALGISLVATFDRGCVGAGRLGASSVAHVCARSRPPPPCPRLSSPSRRQRRSGARARCAADAAWRARRLQRPTGMMFNVVRPERVVDFETGHWLPAGALEKSTNPQVREQARGWRMFKAAEPGPNGTVLYVFLIDPAVAGADYALGPILSDAYPDQIEQIWKLYQGALAGWQPDLLNLTPVKPPPLPPAGTAPAPTRRPPAGPQTAPRRAAGGAGEPTARRLRDRRCPAVRPATVESAFADPSCQKRRLSPA